MNEESKSQELIDLAKSIVKDDSHWSVVDVADRAEDGLSLAEAVLAFFGEAADDCPNPCESCKAHSKNVGADENGLEEEEEEEDVEEDA